MSTDRLSDDFIGTMLEETYDVLSSIDSKVSTCSQAEKANLQELLTENSVFYLETDFNNPFVTLQIGDISIDIPSGWGPLGKIQEGVESFLWHTHDHDPDLLISSLSGVVTINEVIFLKSTASYFIILNLEVSKSIGQLLIERGLIEVEDPSIQKAA
jgi:hypothetical protein